MRYSNAGEILFMTLAWTAVLLVVNKMADRASLEEQVESAFAKPTVAVVLRHLGCEEQQYKDAVQALSMLPWLAEPRVEVEGREQHESAPAAQRDAEPMPHTMTTVAPELPEDPCSVHLFVTIQDVNQADLMQIPTLFRDYGIVPATIEVGGLRHFALRVTVPGLNCEACERAVMAALTPLPVSAAYYFSTTKEKDTAVGASTFTTFRWLANKSANLAENTVTAYVREHATARVQEVIRAVERAGFLPVSIRIVDQT